MSWISEIGKYLGDRWGQGGPTGTVLGAIQGKRGSVNALRNDFGNAVQIGSDIAAPFTGPFAPLVAGAGNALGTGIKPGTNIGNMAKSGAIAGGVAGVGALLGGAYSPSSGTAYGASASPADLGLGAGDVPAVGNASTLPAYNDVASSLGVNTPSSLGGGADSIDPMGAASGSSPWTDSTGGTGTSTSPTFANPVSASIPSSGEDDSLGAAMNANAPTPLGKNAVATAQGGAAGGGAQNPSLLSKVGSFLGKNPNLTGNALTMLGNAPLNEAKARQIALENQLTQQQIDRQKSLDPLRQALAKAFSDRMNNPVAVAPNPYYKGAGIAPNPYTGGR